MIARFLIPAFLIIATIAFLVSLGLWQLERADQKRTIEAAILNANIGPVELVANGRELLDKEYYDVRLQGNYLSDKQFIYCLLYTSPSPRDGLLSRMPSSA